MGCDSGEKYFAPTLDGGVGAWLALVDEGGVVSDLGADVGSLSSRE